MGSSRILVLVGNSQPDAIDVGTREFRRSNDRQFRQAGGKKRGGWVQVGSQAARDALGLGLISSVGCRSLTAPRALHTSSRQLCRAVTLPVDGK